MKCKTKQQREARNVEAILADLSVLVRIQSSVGVGVSDVKLNLRI